MTKSYHDLEASTYEKVRIKKFSRIHGKPTWSNKEALLREAEEVALGCDVHYGWAGEFGMLATILGPVPYLVETHMTMSCQCDLQRRPQQGWQPVQQP